MSKHREKTRRDDQRTNDEGFEKSFKKKKAKLKPIPKNKYRLLKGSSDFFDEEE